VTGGGGGGGGVAGCLGRLRFTGRVTLPGRLTCEVGVEGGVAWDGADGRDGAGCGAAVAPVLVAVAPCLPFGAAPSEGNVAALSSPAALSTCATGLDGVEDVSFATALPTAKAATHSSNPMVTGRLIREIRTSPLATEKLSHGDPSGHQAVSELI